jgi:hypothetical protein
MEWQSPIRLRDLVAQPASQFKQLLDIMGRHHSQNRGEGGGVYGNDIILSTLGLQQPCHQHETRQRHHYRDLELLQVPLIGSDK